MESRRHRDIRAFMALPPFGIRDLGEAELRLIDTALTHDSYSEEHPEAESNGRLEFLGDSVLGLVVCHSIYDTVEGPEGRMTDAKQGIVSNLAISGKVKERLPSLDSMLLVGNGHKGPKGENVLSENMRADAFEALLGAVYLLYGTGMAEKLVSAVLIDPQS